MSAMKWPKWFPMNDPAFRWGLLNPLGPPPPWWSDERRKAYFNEHGVPWSASQRALRRARLRALLTFSDCPQDPDF